MAETTAEVRRDIELTRERMSDTLTQLERKFNVMQIVRDHPWPAIALAVGAGFALSGSSADVKAAAAAAKATGGASSKVGTLLDDLAANLIAGVSAAFHERVDGLVGELKTAIGAPSGRGGAGTGSRPRAAHLADVESDDRGGMRSAGADLPDVSSTTDARSGSDEVLGIDLPRQDSGAIGTGPSRSRAD